MHNLVRSTISVAITLFLFSSSYQVSASDWPIYKGNIYFTGNNDEITVKNNNLKWLFQAEHIVYNPIVSDGKVYFLDLKKNVYCVNEDTGKLIWKVNMIKISTRFRGHSRTMGKVKYPLIKGNRLFLTGGIAIYCLNKNTGRVIWARTGMRHDRSMDNIRKWDGGTSSWQPGRRKSWTPKKSSYAIIDGIYSDPVIHGERLYYGTRNVFISRGIREGHLKWNNANIKTYSGFPSFYDRYIFTQSMDYAKGRFTLNCIDSDNGKIIWSRRIAKPMKIFSPVVYKGRVYMASGKVMNCFKLKDGSDIWSKQHSGYITSNPSFTERAILFVIENRKMVITDPKNGDVKKTIDFGERSSPYFVTIRDHLYIANSFKKRVGKRMLTYSSLKAINFSDSRRIWKFIPPFPGGSYQPSASRGIMFLPAGNYLYAVGTDYYPGIIRGGSTHYDPYNSLDPLRKPDDKSADPRNSKPVKKIKKPLKKKKLVLRKMKISVDGKDKRGIPAEITVKKWDRGKVIYSKRFRVDKPDKTIMVPDMDNVEITASADGYVPKKVIISRKDKKRKITLERIEKGRGIVVDNIYFEFNKAYLKKESLNILDEMIKSMKRNSRLRLEVRGHTDSTGKRSYNKKLSERRADAVVEYMIKNGVSPVRLVSVGLGPDKPLVSNKTRKGRRKNRRTEFFILDK